MSPDRVRLWEKTILPALQMIGVVTMLIAVWMMPMAEQGMATGQRVGGKGRLPSLCLCPSP
jgi:hypothetical protein